MCNERETRMSERRQDWLAGALWALLPAGILALGAALAFLGDLPTRHAWIGLPFAFPAFVLFLAFTWAFPWRWAEFLAETLPEGLQLGILVAICLSAWWLAFTALAYPVCRARRINRSATRLLEVTP